jgi:ribonuclease Z
MSLFNIKRNRLNHIFISHLHGDHIFGLPGLLTSYNHFSRKKPIHIYGVKGIRKLLTDIFNSSYSFLDYEIIYHELEDQSSNIILEDEYLKITSFPLDHRVPTLGYKFEEKSYLNLIPSAVTEYGMTFSEIKSVKRGEDLFRNGVLVPRDQLLYQENKLRSYAYFSDTKYNESNIDIAKNTTVLYHEATYLNDLLVKAEERGHSTALQAATFAKKAEVGKLLLGHFSSRYDKRQVFREEAKKVFKNSIIVKDGMTYQI